MKRKHWFEWLIIFSVVGIIIYESFDPLGDRIEYLIGPAGRFLSNLAIWIIVFRCIYVIYQDSDLKKEIDQMDNLETDDWDETEDNN